MVPFPSAEYYTDPLDHRKRLKKSWANDYLQEHPDGNGLLLPRMKEEIREDEAWRTILGPTHDAVQVVGKGGWKDMVAHGLAEYWARVAFAAGGAPPRGAYLSGAMAISPKMHDKKRYETLEHHLFEEDTLTDRMKFIYDAALTDKIPPETAKKLAAAYPDFLRAAIALSNVAERAYEYGYGKEAHKKFLQGILKPAEIDALIEIMESKITPPHYLVKKFARPEELEAIYKVHKRFLDMFPHLFEERKTPFEELIPEERRRELDEIIEIENKLAEGVIRKKLRAEHILPERKEKRLVQLKKEHYLDALRELGLIREKEERGTKQRITGRLVATFEDEALAREFASIKGGRVIKTPEGKYGVVFEEKEEQHTGRPVATFDDQALAEEFARLKGGKVVQTPEGKYAVVIEKGGGRNDGRPSPTQPRAYYKPETVDRREEATTSEGEKTREAVIGESPEKRATQRKYWVEELLGVPADRIRKHPETGYKYVEKDGKIIVLPGDDPRKLELKGPDPPTNGLEQTFVPYTIMYSRDPVGEIRALAQVYKEIVDGVQKGTIKSFADMMGYGKEKRREFGEKGYKRAKQIVKNIGKVDKSWPETIRLEHVAEEYRYLAVMLYDAAKLAEDALKHPEKYGITGDDRKKGGLYINEKIGKAVEDTLKGKYLRFHYSPSTKRRR